jgi:hypothetical protein
MLFMLRLFGQRLPDEKRRREKSNLVKLGLVFLKMTMADF